MFKKEILQRIKFNGGFHNNHCHMDRVYTINNENLAKSQKHLTEKWSIVTELKQNASVDGMAYRMSKFIENQISQGVSSITTFLDFDKYSEDRPFIAFNKVREQYKKDIDLYCVNQTLHGVIDPESKRWFDIGVQCCDIVGGLPGRDRGNEKEHVDIVLSKAKELNKQAHLHIGQFQDPKCKELDILLDRIKYYKMQNKVSAVHCLSLACNGKQMREIYYQKIKEEGLNIIACPKVWLDHERTETLVPFHNSITAVDEMIKYGIKIGIGTDNVGDLMAPFSDGDMYDELKTLAMACRLYSIDSLVKIATEKLTPRAINTNGILGSCMTDPNNIIYDPCDIFRNQRYS